LAVRVSNILQEHFQNVYAIALKQKSSQTWLSQSKSKSKKAFTSTLLQLGPWLEILVGRTTPSAKPTQTTMMRSPIATLSLLQLALLVLFNPAADAQADPPGKPDSPGNPDPPGLPDLEDICHSTYSVQLGVNYPGGEVVQCTDVQFAAITAIIHSVVELDVVTSMLGTSVADFAYYDSMYGDNVVKVLTAENAKARTADRLSQKELAQPYLTMEDKLEDMQYELLGEGEDEDEDTNSTTNGRRQLLEIGQLAPAKPVHRELQVATYSCYSFSSCRADWCVWKGTKTVASSLSFRLHQLT
jgi:hypothetical protein